MGFYIERYSVESTHIFSTGNPVEARDLIPYLWG